jgi:hypothetical protein
MQSISGLINQLVTQALLRYEQDDEEAVKFLIEAGMLGPRGFTLGDYGCLWASQA